MLGDCIFMQNTVLASFGPQPKPFEWVFKSPDIALGGVILAVTVGAVVFRYFFFKPTLPGKKLQANVRLRRLLGNKSVYRAVRRPEAGWHRQPGRILCGHIVQGKVN
ncbi:MAG TPA: hypothetical protein VFW43_08355 [Polaromonas sp.]|nr:hypothetical protein [Polaromonas sp.]